MFTGCIISDVDLRDYRVTAPVGQLPQSFMLKLPMGVKNQGNVGSCVAHAVSSILEYHESGSHNLSTNFIYGFESRYQPGMQLRDACQIVKDYGDVELNICPGNYEIPEAHQEFAKNITSNNITSGQQYRIDSYYKCDTPNDIKYAIYNYGPVLAAMVMPDNYSINPINGQFNVKQIEPFCYHAIVIYGWDETGFWCLNSWGRFWGKNGTFHLNYSDNLIVEARALVDYKSEDDLALKQVKTNKITNIGYKTANKVFNLFQKFQKNK